MEKGKLPQNKGRIALLKGGPGAVFYVTFCTALLLYFISESTLRQAAVSSVDPDEISLDAVIGKLPPGLQDSVTYNLELARMKEDLQFLSKPEDKLMAFNTLASFTRDPDERETIYAEIVKSFPDKPQSAAAYRYFLLAENAAKKVSIKDYQKFIAQCPPIKRPSLWNGGLNKLRELKSPDMTIVEYLSPLLKTTPDFRDYHDLYEALMKAAKKIDAKEQDVEKARRLRDKCISLKSVERILMEREIEKNKKKKKKPGKRKKKTGAKKPSQKTSTTNRMKPEAKNSAKTGI